MNLTPHERVKYRKIQDEFLKHPLVVKHIAEHGEDSEIAWGGGNSPTYAQLKTTLYPNWVPWILDFLRPE